MRIQELVPALPCFHVLVNELIRDLIHALTRELLGA